MQKFPVMSLSIAVIEDVNEKISHYGQISEIVSGLKSIAKEKLTSLSSLSLIDSIIEEFPGSFVRGFASNADLEACIMLSILYSSSY